MKHIGLLLCLTKCMSLCQDLIHDANAKKEIAQRRKKDHLKIYSRRVLAWFLTL